MAKAIFLSETKLKESTVLNENIDVKVLSPIIWKVQELRILELLGTALYEDMMNEINNNTTNGVTNTSTMKTGYGTLLTDYIQPCMIQYCVCDSTPELAIKFMNVGINKKNTDNTSSVDYSDILRMIERYQADAEIYQNRLIRYLIAKANTLFPLYYAVGQDLSYIYPKRDSFTSPIYLGDQDRGNIWGLDVMQGGPLFPYQPD